MSKYRLSSELARAYDPLAGKYVSLADRLFGLDATFTGLWHPNTFDQAIGFQILMEGPHDPRKLPVLLLHGILRGPRSMEALGNALDHDRFEPWYAFYPTGLGIDSLSAAMRTSLAETCEDEGVDRVAIVAFSMGGLVARGALGPAEVQADLPEIPVFVAASTPWGGSVHAVFFAKQIHSPETFKDLLPGSDFMEHLFDDPLPDSTAFHMIYGSGGNSPSVPGEDDGVVEIESLSLPEALAEAETVTFYDYLDHQGIVTDPVATARISELLASALDGE